MVKVDRVEWLPISDAQTAVNALLAGEIDTIEDPPLDLLPVLTADRNVGLFNFNTLGNQYVFRLNHLQTPFDNPKIRQALSYAFNQKDFLNATDRQCGVLQDLQGAVHLRHAVCLRQGHGGLLHSDFGGLEEAAARRRNMTARRSC